MNGMRFGMATHVGKVREKNEDSMGARGDLFVIADGMGGHNAGEIASALAVEYVLGMNENEKLFDEALQDAVNQANAALLETSRQNPDCNGMGTTLAVLKLMDDEAVIAHVGDSRIYHWREGEIQRVTRDHSLVEELIINGGITSEQARSHPQRHILTRALGSLESPEITIEKIATAPGDRFLLCSDGLTGVIDDEALKDVIGSRDDLQALAEYMVDLANERGGPDNISVILVER